jgi:hypothetical protein
MPLWLLLVLLGVGGFAAYQFWRGLKFGNVWTRYSYADRSKNPMLFWVFFALYGVGALLLLLISLFLVISRGVSLAS